MFVLALYICFKHFEKRLHKMGEAVNVHTCLQLFHSTPYIGVVVWLHVSYEACYGLLNVTVRVVQSCPGPIGGVLTVGVCGATAPYCQAPGEQPSTPPPHPPHSPTASTLAQTFPHTCTDSHHTCTFTHVHLKIPQFHTFAQRKRTVRLRNHANTYTHTHALKETFFFYRYSFNGLHVTKPLFRETT